MTMMLLSTCTRIPYLDNTNILSDIQFAFSLEGIQIPELRGVTRGGEGVSSGGVNGDGVDRRIVALHPCYKFLSV